MVGVVCSGVFATRAAAQTEGATISLVEGGTLSFGSSGGTLSLPNYNSGSGSTLTLTGASTSQGGTIIVPDGNLTLSGTNNTSTTLTASNGTLVLGGTPALADQNFPSFAPGTITLLGGSIIPGNRITATNGTFAFPSNTIIILSHTILGQSFTCPTAATSVDGNLSATYSAAGLPRGLTVDPTTGVITGAATALGTFYVTSTASSPAGASTRAFLITVAPLPFFNGQVSLGSGVYYAGMSAGQNFGEYSFLDDADYLYSYDLASYEYVLDANDSNRGIYLYDFASHTWFYTSPSFPYPYVYDFSRGATLYYYQGGSGPRYFYDFSARQVITK